MKRGKKKYFQIGAELGGLLLVAFSANGLHEGLDVVSSGLSLATEDEEHVSSQLLHN